MENNQLDDRRGFIPVLPLILGGDDLFALIPAPWALDLAGCFCRVYEKARIDLFERLGIEDVLPTVSVAVVICKSNHSYTLAYEAGQAKLKEAKQFSKRRVISVGSFSSMVNFEVVLGGRLLPGLADDERQLRRPTLRPYQATGGQGDEQGLPLQDLVDERWELRHIPRKRLVELRNLYDNPDSYDNNNLDVWTAKLERVVERIRQRTEKQGASVRKTLERLGTCAAEESGYWRWVDRFPDDIWRGHGLPDLLEAWEFTLRLNEPASAYEEGW